jgi:hypothetical protein
MAMHWFTMENAPVINACGLQVRLNLQYSDAFSTPTLNGLVLSAPSGW